MNTKGYLNNFYPHSEDDEPSTNDLEVIDMDFDKDSEDEDYYSDDY